jgi:hypothetical protein
VHVQLILWSVIVALLSLSLEHFVWYPCSVGLYSVVHGGYILVCRSVRHGPTGYATCIEETRWNRTRKQELNPKLVARIQVIQLEIQNLLSPSPHLMKWMWKEHHTREMVTGSLIVRHDRVRRYNGCFKFSEINIGGDKFPNTFCGKLKQTNV